MTATSSAPGAPVDAGTARTGSPLVTVVVLCLGGLVASLTQTMVIPIQGQLAGLLHTSEANASWVITSTLVAGAIAMPISGRLGDLFGKQRVLAISAGVLLVGSLVCALSNSLVPMLAGRLLQGFAMGFIPVGIALLREVTPPRLTATAMAAMSATLGVGGAIGLPLSAWIVQDYSWHTLFWVSTGLAAVVALAVVLLVPHVKDAVPGRFDVVGAIGLALGLVALLVAVSKGNEWGWSHGRTLGLIVTGVLVLLAWGSYELRVSDPLCDLRVSARRPVLLTNAAAIAIGFGMMAQAIVVPRLLQSPSATGYGLDQTLLETGLWMAPGGLVMMAFSPISGRLIRVVGARVTLMLGGTVLGMGYVFALFLTDAPWQLMVASCINSAGVGIGYAAMPTLILESVPLAEAGSGVGINGLMRSIGTSVSSAVMAAILTSATIDLGGHELPSEDAFAICFGVGAAAAFLGVLLAALVPRRRLP
ncbi:MULTISPECIES: MFS transporter [Pimelobacter]|uniref:MFS transporter n=1 Tax=Pimelobacter TaxID=2044 RepID=UPI001C04EEE5|nr:MULTISPECIES: MFS transporter [Pimelobacter]MBU2696882.1 MFS transporter [Pimelobacter sp. 30-1]UUW87297.1 MFS transporter [Pimelobacter simplex]UUW96803.1 MFS transporter [Pimelobacter simplex]